jgi:protein-S-isoprenylcysteine O-methyltransferase Ste14
MAETTRARRDIETGPDVLVHPPLLLAGAVALGLFSDACWGLRRKAMPPELRYGLGAPLVLGGSLLAGLAIFELLRARTGVPTFRPATALVTRGIYARTRNPIYLGGLLFYPGLALLLGSPGMLLLWPAIAGILDRGVVRREEAYLRRLFGRAYEDYRGRVRRWL